MAREGQELPGQGEPQPDNMVEAAGKPLAGRREEASLGRAAGERVKPAERMRGNVMAALRQATGMEVTADSRRER